MRIAITGSSGLLGKNLFRKLEREHEVIGISRKKSNTTTHSLDITSEEFIEQLREINPDIVVHGAALTYVDYCETHPDEAKLVNSIATRRIAEEASEKNRKLIYISTDAVYPGITNKYDESSETNPLNVYGKTKFQGEMAVRDVRDSLVLRTTGTFGYDIGGLNFLMQMLNLKQERKIPNDMYGNPTDVNILTEYIARSIQQNLTGLYVASGPETLNRYDFASLISDVLRLDRKNIVGVPSSEIPCNTPRALYNGTNPSKIRKDLDYHPCSVRESLENIAKKLV